MNTTVRQRIEALRDRLEALKQQAETVLSPEHQALIAEAQDHIAAARQELGHIEALIESFPDHIFSLDRYGTYLDSNDRVAQFGLERGASLIGRHLHEVYSPELAELYQQQLERVLATGQSVSFEHVMTGPDGEHVHLDTLYPIWQEDQVQAVGGICHDITAYRQAEQAFQQSNRDLVQLYRVSQTLTSTLDLRQVMRRLLQAVTEIVGAQGGSVWLWDKERPGELICQAVFHPDREHLLVGQRLRSEQGVAGWVAHHGKTARVADAPSDPRFYSGVDDRTGFKTHTLLTVPLRVHDAVIGVLEMVNKLRGEFDEHDQALVETLAGPAAIAIDNALLVEALRDFAATLQARNEDLDAFAHTVAHDLRHPLTLMIGFAEALMHDYVTLPPERQQRYLQNIWQSANRMNNIVDELLLLSEVRRTDKQRMPLDMIGIVAQAQQRLADMIEQYHADIVTLDPSAWPQAMGYGPWIEQVWVNYLSNAIKYGGRPPRVELGATSQSDGTVRFWVRDNGNGLTPENQARLFKPFTRLDQVRAQGYGLGLSIAQRIVEKLGGQVGVESAGVPGQGAVFFFTLPLATSTA